MKFVLDEQSRIALRDWLGAEQETDAVTLHVGPGHSGDGLYVSSSEYPEEGADFLGAAQDEPQAPTTFEKELESLINRYSKENGSNTPDFILAAYMGASLDAFNAAVKDRERWYGREPQPLHAVVG